MGLCVLPDEVLLPLVRLLSIRDRLNLSLCSTRLAELVEETWKAYRCVRLTSFAKLDDELCDYWTARDSILMVPNLIDCTLSISMLHGKTETYHLSSLNCESNFKLVFAKIGLHLQSLELNMHVFTENMAAFIAKNSPQIKSLYIECGMPLSNQQLSWFALRLAHKLKRVQFGSNVVCRQGLASNQGLELFFKNCTSLLCVELGCNYYFEGSMSEEDWVERSVKVENFFNILPSCVRRLEVLSPILWSFPAQNNFLMLGKSCQNLKHLRLYRTRIEGNLFVLLPNLECLYLFNCYPKASTELIRLQSCQALKTFVFFCEKNDRTQKITDETLVFVGSQWYQLKCLDLSFNSDVSFCGLKPILLIAKLSRLILDYTGINEAGLFDILKSIPNCFCELEDFSAAATRLSTLGVCAMLENCPKIKRIGMKLCERVSADLWQLLATHECAVPRTIKLCCFGTSVFGSAYDQLLKSFDSSAPLMQVGCQWNLTVSVCVAPECTCSFVLDYCNLEDLQNLI